MCLCVMAGGEVALEIWVMTQLAHGYYLPYRLCTKTRPHVSYIQKRYRIVSAQSRLAVVPCGVAQAWSNSSALAV